MSEAAAWIGAPIGALAGVLLGWLYFRGLQLTIDRLPNSHHPGTWVVGSFALRAATTVAAFMLITRLVQGHGLVAALLGFIAVRTVMIRRTRRAQGRDTGASSAS